MAIKLATKMGKAQIVLGG